MNLPKHYFLTLSNGLNLEIPSRIKAVKASQRGILSKLGLSDSVDIPSSISLEASLDIEAASKAEDGTEADTVLNIVANSGKVPMNLNGFPYPVIIDLAGASFAASKTPIIFDHKTHLRLGFTLDQSIDAVKGILAKGVVTSASRAAKEFVSDARKKFPFQTSVGADILKAFLVDEGDTVRVNGKDHKGPLIVASKTKIKELSVTTLGADPLTSTRIAATRKNPTTEIETMTLQEWIKANATKLRLMGCNPDSITKEQMSIVEAWYKADIQASGLPDDDGDDDDAPERIRADRKKMDQDERNRRADEEERVSSIKALAKGPEYEDLEEASIPDAFIARYPDAFKAAKGGKKLKVSQITAAAIRSGMTSDEFDLLLMKADRPNPIEFSGGIHVSGINADIQGQALSCAIVKAIGTPAKRKNAITGAEYGYETQYSAEALEASDKIKGITLHQLMDITIQAATGHIYHGNRKSQDFLRAAYAADKQLRAAGQTFSTVSVSNVLEDASNKRLLNSYQAQEVVWPFFTAETSLSDFKIHNTYRLDNRSRYQKLGAGGEIKHGALSDAKYTIQAETFAVMIALTRQQMINDDLGAFNQIPDSLGILAAIALESAFFVLLLSNPGSFFASGNGNLQTGAGTNLNIAGLGAAELAFSNQVDANGNPILVSADRILVGTQDFTAASVLYNDTKIIDATVSIVGGESNPHAGKYQPYKSPYLNNTSVKNHETGAAITGQDSDQWYIFANPALLPAFIVGFLNGQRTPTLESAETDFATLGMQWRSYHDWGIGIGDPKGAVKMAGA